MDQTLTSQMQAELKNRFQLPSFRKGQQEIISAILEGHDVLAVLPTGGGKSLCYQLPATLLNKLVLVVSPLIALMRDQVLALKTKGIPAGSRHSGQSLAETQQLFSELGKAGAFVFYVSPERVQDLRFQQWLAKQDVGLFAIDEAHCVSQWGHDFREEYSQLSILKKIRPEVPTLALTASATPMVLNDIAIQLGLNKPKKMVHGFYRSNLFYQVEFCADEETKYRYVEKAIKQFPTGRVLIYAGTRKSVEALSEHLQKKFSNVDYYHAGIGSEKRTEVQNAYVQGKTRILVATNAFGMGIDQPDVRLVVHLQMPANIDSLYQEMGRAGRDGNPSTCLLLYSRKDIGLQSYFIESSDSAKKIKDLRWKNLDALTEYAEGSECRHAEILTYYQDSQRIKTCGHCDVCAPNSESLISRPAVESLVNIGTTRLKKKSTLTKLPFEIDSLNSEQEARFQALRNWRRLKAESLDIPAFVVFGDKTLRQLALKNPRSSSELLSIYGIGESKLEVYGSDLLKCLNEI